jgi:hypothetical protein
MTVRISERCDGGTAVFDEDSDDLIIVEPRVTAFAPVTGNAFCVCGAPLRSYGWQCVAADAVELSCNRCHRVHGHFLLGTKVHR